MLSSEEAASLAAFFKAFDDESRIRIVSCLYNKELCVGDLCEALSMTKSAVSHQLAILREKRLVKARRDGKNIYYSLDDDHVKTVFEMGLEHINHE